MGVFDEVYVYNESDLDNSFRLKYCDKLISGSRGFGYWCWKPHVILNTMERLAEGDLLQYTDAGCHLNSSGVRRLEEYFEMAAKSRDGILAFQATEPEYPLPSLPCTPLDLMDYRWIKGDLLDYFEVREKPQIVRTPTIGAGIIFLRNCESARRLIRSWARVIDDGFYLVDDTPSRSPNLTGFVEHRHDQAIFSLLCKIEGIDTVSAYEYWYPKKDGVTPDWKVLRDYPIHARRDKGMGIKKIASKIRQVVLHVIRK